MATESCPKTQVDCTDDFSETSASHLQSNARLVVSIFAANMRWHGPTHASSGCGINLVNPTTHRHKWRPKVAFQGGIRHLFLATNVKRDGKPYSVNVAVNLGMLGGRPRRPNSVLE